MKVLVTGARGFVGHAIVENILSETDWTVFYEARPPKPRDRLEDITDPGRVLLYDGERVDVIIHAAGNPSALACIAEPKEAIQSNIEETFRILELARKHKVSRVVYVSTCDVYGNTKGSAKEDSFCEATNMYAATKLAGEHMCTAYSHSYKVPFSIVRLTNTFGPRCQPERFPVVAIKKLLNNEKIKIHCDAEGQPIRRRWAPIRDVASMIVFILKECPPGEIYNLTGENISNFDFLNYISSAMDRPFEYIIEPENIEGRLVYCDAPPDCILARGWRASVSFEERVKEFVLWTLNHPEWQ
jgi:dTDP-glucose 4,6-dehydratase